MAFKLPKQYLSHWLSNNNDDLSLADSINEFIDRYQKTGMLTQRYNTYFSHLDVFDYVDSLHYLRRIKDKLLRYNAYFNTVAKGNEFDERFLAAVSYQESHWKEKARSYTGVSRFDDADSGYGKTCGG